MAQATGTMEILDPTAEDVPEEVGLNDALPDLKGKVVGLLENRKYHADAFLGELKEVLLNDYGAAKIVFIGWGTACRGRAWRTSLEETS